jgi:hypothetical protein
LEEKEEKIKKLSKYKMKYIINKKCELLSDDSLNSSIDSISSSEMEI